jgi:hypothetical protein
MSSFTFITQALGYNDQPRNSNPVLSGVNRRIQISNIPVDHPQTLSGGPLDLAPGASCTVFNGSRSLLVDGTTAFSLSLSPANPTTYRLLNTGGTAPGFRTARSIPISGVALTLSVGANLALTISAATGSPFSAALGGDTLFIPGVSTGDPASPFNALNEGLWYVLTPGTTSIVVARDPSQVFSGISEVVTPASNTQLQIFSSDNVQVGDTVGLSLGFATSALHAFDISAVTPLWVEFTSVLPLGPQAGILPTAAGIAIYTSAKRWVSIETDQEILYQLNGDTGLFNKITPIIPGSCDLHGTFHTWSTIWELVLLNKSSAVAHITVCSVE